MSQDQATVDDMSVVILCGGQGTRIREASESLPKPLIDIGGKPILWHIMKIYSHYGIRRFVLALGYKGWGIKRFFLDYREHVSDLSVHLSDRHEIHVPQRTLRTRTGRSPSSRRDSTRRRGRASGAYAPT